MQTEQIVALLVAERNRLDAAIHALQGPTKRRGRPPATKVSAPAVSASSPNARKRKISAAGRRAMADAAKKRWAAIKAGKAPNPFAKKPSKKGAYAVIARGQQCRPRTVAAGTATHRASRCHLDCLRAVDSNAGLLVARAVINRNRAPGRRKHFRDMPTLRPSKGNVITDRRGVSRFR